MTVHDIVHAAIAPVRKRIEGMVQRAVLQLVDDSQKMQEVQFKGIAGEVRDKCERPQQYGFTGVPLEGAEAFVIFVAGNRAHPLVLSVDDRRYRLKNLQPGEVAMYTDQGDYVLIKRGGTAEVKAATKLLVTAPAVDTTTQYMVNGTKVVGTQGAAVPDSTPTAADVSAKLNLLLARCRAHGLIA